MTLFTTTVLQGGKTATGLEVPPKIVDGLASGKRPKVRVTVGNHTYRSTVARMGGKFLIPLSAENRSSAGVAAGDKVDVRLELDTAPRKVAVPDDFAVALDRDQKARDFFASLSYSEKRWFVMGIEEAKKAETRERRIARAVERLSSGRGQR